MKAEKIIDSLKFTFEEADEQKDLFTPAHVLNAGSSTRKTNAAILLITSVTRPQPMSRRKKIVYIVFSPMPLVLIAAQMKPTFWRSSDILTAERIRLEKV